jgi:hypothetical protein
MHILNFSHPLTDAQRADIEQAIGQSVDGITDVPVQFHVDQPFIEQVVALIDGLNIASQHWQSETWLVVPPSLTAISAVVIAELHGRTGHFPAIIRLKPRVTPVGTSYDFAEIINLEAVRQTARTRR